MFTRDAIVGLTTRVRGTLDVARGRYPATADRESGSWDWSDDGAWVGGFWPGLLWVTAVATDDEALLAAAGEAALRLEPRVTAHTALRGLLFWYGAAYGDYLGLATPAVSDMARRAAASLVAAIDPASGVVPPLSEDVVYDWPSPGVAVDALAGTVPLLAWAGHLDEAMGHARGTVRLCARPDASYAQTATYDERGVLVQRTSVNGIAPDSTWARGQAWAMLGLAYGRTLDAGLARQSDRAIDWWVEHAPESGIPAWDFDAPDDHPRDTSAAAIAAAAMVQAGRLQDAAHTVAALERDHLSSDGRLVDGCLNYRAGLAVGSELVWGDFFLLEAAVGLDRATGGATGA